MNYFRTAIKNADKILLLLPVVFAVWSVTMISSTYYDDGFVISRDACIQAAAYVIGFICVVFTYIGVNTLLPGIHSYA